MRTPSPRVLAGLADALGLDYAELMKAVGYEPPPSDGGPETRHAAAVKRHSNAHIVELLEELRRDVAEVHALLIGAGGREGR